MAWRRSGAGASFPDRQAGTRDPGCGRRDSPVASDAAIIDAIDSHGIRSANPYLLASTGGDRPSAGRAGSTTGRSGTSFDGRLGPASLIEAEPLARDWPGSPAFRLARCQRLPDAGDERFLKSVVEGEGEDTIDPAALVPMLRVVIGGSGGRLDLAARRAALPIRPSSVFRSEGAQPGSRAASATSTGNPAASRRDCRRARKHPMSPRRTRSMAAFCRCGAIAAQADES